MGGEAVFVRFLSIGGRTACPAFLCALMLSGCGMAGVTSQDDESRTTLSLATLGADDESTYYESGGNDLLKSAERVDIDADARVIRGTVSSASDVDTYDLGPVSPGDRIIVDMATDGSLDGAIALFDEQEAALLVNDHRNVYLGEANPFIDVVIRRASDSCTVAVAATPGYRAQGDYGLIASKETPVAIPAGRPDTVLLVFDGDNDVRIGSRAPVNVPPFDAASISDTFSGMTDEMIDRVVEAVRADYAGLNVTILSTSEGAAFQGSMTRLFFGTYDPALLGVAEGVDEFNGAASQEAIVFTDTFEAFAPLNPSVEQIAQAIANVASHEIGHLLGLVHTRDPRGIMDVTASLNNLMRDQSFSKSPLYEQVFPVGSQDAIQSLLDAVGGDQLLTTLKYFGADHTLPGTRVKQVGPPARERLHFSSCGLDAP